MLLFQTSTIFRNSHHRYSLENGTLKNFTKKVFSCEFCENLKNTFFTEHLLATAFDFKIFENQSPYCWYVLNSFRNCHWKLISDFSLLYFSLDYFMLWSLNRSFQFINKMFCNNKEFLPTWKYRFLHASSPRKVFRGVFRISSNTYDGALFRK